MSDSEWREFITERDKVICDVLSQNIKMYRLIREALSKEATMHPGIKNWMDSFNECIDMNVHMVQTMLLDAYEAPEAVRNPILTHIPTDSVSQVRALESMLKLDGNSDII